VFGLVLLEPNSEGLGSARVPGICHFIESRVEDSTARSARASSGFCSTTGKLTTTDFVRRGDTLDADGVPLQAPKLAARVVPRVVCIHRSDCPLRGEIASTFLIWYRWPAQRPTNPPATSG